MIFATEEIDTHDGEDEPEDEAHEEHIDDGRDGSHQGVYHNLRYRQCYSMLHHQVTHYNLEHGSVTLTLHYNQDNVTENLLTVAWQEQLNKKERKIKVIAKTWQVSVFISIQRYINTWRQVVVRPP